MRLRATPPAGQATPMQVEELHQGGESWIVVTPKTIAPKRPFALVAGPELGLELRGCGAGDDAYPEAGGTRWVAPIDAAGNLGEAWTVELQPP